MPAADPQSYALDCPDVSAAGLLAALQQASGGSLSWRQSGRPQAQRRTWLDTFDSRLHRAGLTLVQVAAGGTVQLVVTGHDGLPAARQDLDGREPPWPCLAAALPAGPARDAVAGPAGIRALAPVARAAARVSELRALDARGTTVARLSLDAVSAESPAAAALVPRLTLRGARGHRELAVLAARAVEAVPGVRPGAPAVLADILAAAGLTPGARPGKAAAAVLDPQAPAGPAVAEVLAGLLGALEANVAGALAGTDTEFLHDLRVALRWTRAVLKLCGGALPGGLARAWSPEFRWLGQLTAPARDLDVFLLAYPAMAARLQGQAPADLEPLRAHLAAARAAARGELAAGLASARFTRLRPGWRSALAGVAPRRGEPAVAHLGRQKVAAMQRKVAAAGARIGPDAPPEFLHDLRKRCKELRYLTEMFGSLPGVAVTGLRELRALQDCLGELQDSEVLHAAVRDAAAQLLGRPGTAAATLLAMGEAGAALAARQQRARAQFGGAFAAWAGAAEARTAA